VTGPAATASAATAPTATTPVATVPAAPRPRLHLPDEPVARREIWYRAVLDGADLDEVVRGADGVAGWLWHRWRILDRSGLDRQQFDGLVAGYRREIWLWLAGERTWAQCCAGLVGRVERRIPT
jgi:hypothetical protein